MTPAKLGALVLIFALGIIVGIVVAGSMVILGGLLGVSVESIIVTILCLGGVYTLYLYLVLRYGL